MGLFDFVKEAGEKLGGKIFDATHDDIDLSAPVEIPPERLNELRQQNIARSIAQLDIEGEQVTVVVDGSQVVLEGTAPTQSDCEKITLIAGNQNGISQVDCRLVADKLEPESVFYTVQPGDSLSKIAKAQYGDAGKYMVIFEANQPMLSDPNKIYPGQQLRIPAL